MEVLTLLRLCWRQRSQVIGTGQQVLFSRSCPKQNNRLHLKIESKRQIACCLSIIKNRMTASELSSFSLSSPWCSWASSKSCAE